MVKGAFDYIGLNYYTSRFIHQAFDYDMFGGKVITALESKNEDVHGNGLGRQAAGREDIFDYPDGLRQLLLHMKVKYGDPELYITENGVSTKPDDIDDSIPNLISAGKIDKAEKEINDDARLNYVRGHLKACDWELLFPRAMMLVILIKVVL
ncbi:Beta-glucosidase 10 [Bienertia sinuspersici]